MRWFDAYRALAEIERGDMPLSDPPSAPRLSVVSEGGNPPEPAPEGAARLARLARLAPAPDRNPETPPEVERPADPADPARDTFKHGRSITGDPRTWTGRIVSLAEWRRLSDWDRDGPNGRHFYGDTRCWEPPRGPG